MEIPTHPLLALVESNRNGLKSMLTSYIDDTVDNQFDFLKKSILKMINNGQIGPQSSDITAFDITLPPPAQIGQLTATLKHQNILQNEVLLSKTINTDEQMIKQEFDEEDREGEDIDDDSVGKCENCEKGICKSVRDNYDNVSRNNSETEENGDEPLESQQNVDAALESNRRNQSTSSNDILPNPTNAINTELRVKQECLQSFPITTHSNNAASNDISIYEPIEGQNASIPADQFDNNVDYCDYSENGHLNQSNCEDCANGVCDLDHENNNNNHLDNDEPFETQTIDAAQEDNQINQSMISNGIEEATENANNEFQVNDESDQLHNVRRSNEQNTKKKTGHLNKSGNRQSERSVIGQIDPSTPSTSGVRSSTRKRIQKKVFGDDQLNDDVKRPKGEKRKSVQSNKSVNKVKRLKIENADEDIDDDGDNDDQEEVKDQILTLKLNCTEPDCSQTETSRSSWREHMRNDHHKLPHHQLKSNARLNDRDQTEYICIEPTCNLIFTTYKWLINHWNHYHQPGEFKCSLCPFVANLHYKVRSHFNATHGSHECTHCREKFSSMSTLKRHERVHTGERPYKCTWKKCQSRFKEIGHAVKHVRIMHFNLPKTRKEQNELNIIDSRNALDYIYKD